MKLYDRPKRINDDYLEVHYHEYKDGRKIGEGDEDFSPVRFAGIPRYEIRVWDGHTYNRGGKRVFESHLFIKTTGTPKELKAFFAHLGTAIATYRLP